MSNEEIIQELRREPPPTEETRKELLFTLYQQNLTMIKRFLRPYFDHAEPEDLLQEAFFSVADAAADYEPEKGKFLTFLAYYVKRDALQYLNKNRAVKLPLNFDGLIFKYRRFRADYFKQHGFFPSQGETKKALGVSDHTLELLKVHSMAATSLDAPHDDGSANAEGGSVSLSDTLTDDLDVEELVVDRIYKEELNARLWGILEEKTTPQENKVLTLRFRDNLTYAEIGEKLGGLAPDRVRVILNTGLMKVKRNREFKGLTSHIINVRNETFGNGIMSYRHNNFTSGVERQAVEVVSLLEEYKKKFGFEV